MAFTAKIAPSVTQQQAAIIPIATAFNAGVMTEEQVAMLEELARAQGLTWLKSKNMPNPPRWGFPMIVLADGTIFCVMGNANLGLGAAGSPNDGMATNTDQRFNSAGTGGQGNWMNPGTAFPGVGRIFANAVKLQDGRVLACGGFTGTPFPFPFPPPVVPPGQIIADAAIWDPSTKTWTAIAAMPVGISNQLEPNILLQDGRAVFFGNFGSDSALLTGSVPVLSPGGALYECTQSMVIYNPISNAWAAGASLNKPRGLCTNTLMQNGQILVTGGNAHFPDGGTGFVRQYQQDGEVYDPVGDTWTPTDLMPLIQGEDYITVPPVLAANGDVIVPGDLEVFGPGSRNQHASCLLPNGKVLITGGNIYYFTPTGKAGTTASFAASGNPGTVILNGVSGMVATAFDSGGDIRNWISISGAANAGNNSIPGPQAFPIYNVLSPTSVEIYNPAANPIDGNNGAISWVVKEPYSVSDVRSSAFLFDPNAAPGSQYQVIPSMLYKRADHVMLRKSNGNILAICGYTGAPDFLDIATTEEFDAVGYTWTRSQNVEPAIQQNDPTFPTTQFTSFFLRGVMSAGLMVIGGARGLGSANQPAPKVVYFVEGQ